jgi:putative ABC transport system permease protein
MEAREPRALRVYRALLRAFPPRFRLRFEDDLVELFADLHAAAPSPRLRWWSRIVLSTLGQGLAERVTARRAPRGRGRPGKDPLMTTLLHDVRLALRSFRARPGFAVTVVLTMAFGIGVTSAMFTVLNAVLLRPLPYREPGRVVMLFERDPRGQTSQVSIATVEDWRAHMTTVSRIALFGSQTANLTGRGEPDRMRAGFVSAEFFEVLGVTPVIGRDFVAGEDRPGAAGVAVLPHGVWERRFGSDPTIVGRSLTLNNQPFEVIGVLPRRFEFPFDEIEVFLPLSATPALPPPARDRRAMFAFARLAGSASIDTANVELQRVTAAIAAAYPDTSTGWSGEVVPFHSIAVRQVQTPLYILMAAVCLVLLIACVNVANLTLARGSGRGQEMAVRAALGASRSRLVAQLLTESVTLAIAGGVLGLLLGSVLTEALLSIAPALPRRATIGPDPMVLAFTAAVSLFTGLAFGILPALRGSRAQVAEGLQHATRVIDAGGRRVRGALVVAELALSLTLLVCAGLLGKSLAQMASADPGFVPDRVLTMEYRLPRNKYGTADEQWDVHQRIAARVAEVPGIEHAALASAVPFSGNGGRVSIWRAEDPEPDPDAALSAVAILVTDGYFEAMGIPMVAGRGCAAADSPRSPRSIIVNRMLAERLWPGRPAIGQRLRSAGMNGEATVIGVVGNTLHASQRAGMGSQLYACLSQAPGLFATVVARTAGDPLQSARAVQQAVWSVDPDQPVWKIRSMAMLVSSGVERERLVTTLMMAAALLALALAALGVYSVVSHSVAQRSREVAVRMALGASRGAILQLVLRETGAVVLLGLAAGVLSALGAGRAIASQLVDVAPGDPLTLALTGILLAVAAIAAAALPAARASSVDPVAGLRE